MTHASPNITHTFIIFNKEIFYIIGIPNTFSTVFYNHTFPTILFFSFKMLTKTSFRVSRNTNLHIFIITMILPNTTNERWNNIGWVSFIIEIFNFHLVCSNLVMLIKLLTLYSSKINLS